MSSTRTGEQVLEETFLDIRAKLIDLAASLDRIDRADTTGTVGQDPRTGQIQESLQVLSDESLNRAEQIQMIFSDEYVAGWNK